MSPSSITAETEHITTKGVNTLGFYTQKTFKNEPVQCGPEYSVVGYRTGPTLDHPTDSEAETVRQRPVSTHAVLISLIM